MHSIQQDQHAAEESLRELSRAVEQSADTVVVTDRQGIIEYVNPAFEALTGYHHDEVHGKSPRILKAGEQGPRNLPGNVEDHSRGKCVYRGILVNRKKNGELYYVEESICPVRDTDGQITRV
jgi:PAS domain S-box-containing protein